MKFRLTITPPLPINGLRACASAIPHLSQAAEVGATVLQLLAEASGTTSACVPGLPIYAAADSAKKAERAIRAVLAAYLEAHPDSRPGATVRVARYSGVGMKKVDIVSVAALVGAKRSATKARASRANGQLGGRPPKTATSSLRLGKTAR